MGTLRSAAPAVVTRKLTAQLRCVGLDVRPQVGGQDGVGAYGNDEVG